MKSIVWSLIICVVAMASAAEVSAERWQSLMDRQEQDLRAAQDDPQPQSAAATPCVAGDAAGFPCDEVDLLATMTLADFGSPDNGADIWGWTDPQTGIEYAILCLSNGTAFISLDDPEAPELIGTLPTHSVETLWRDAKVYADHAYIVSEAADHGMQVFDLNELRTVALPPVTFTETAHYDGITSTHNVVVNEDAGYAYVVGSHAGSNDCDGGLHIVDLSDPANPSFAGCFDEDGYSHDAQCVTYTGPDPDYHGRQICINGNEDTITIADVTDPANSVQISRAGYPNPGYIHQAWLTDDQRYLIQDDELDEFFFGVPTTTYIWDLQDLDSPVVVDSYVEANSTVIDHNQYTRGHLLYQSNYRGGILIYDLSDVANGNLTQVGFFDTWPDDDDTNFGHGMWSVYPYFESGVVIAGGYEGLFVLQPTINQAPLCDAGGEYVVAVGDPLQLDASGSSDPDDGIASYTWDFGDGSNDAGAIVSHTYAAPGTYIARVQVADVAGAIGECGAIVRVTGTTAVSDAAPAPKQRVVLNQNEPNPFNPSTRITFELENAGRVALRIYDARGAEVRTLVDGHLDAEPHAFVWNGRDAAEQLVSSGVYFYQLETARDVLVRKMMLVK